MRAEDRLLALLSMPDGGEITQKSRARAAAFSAGIEYVKGILSDMQSCTALKVFTHPTADYIKTVLDGIEYEAKQGKVTITKYDSDTVGEKISRCFFTRCGIDLGSNGLTWTEIEEKSAPWAKIKRLKYRWDMIESR